MSVKIIEAATKGRRRKLKRLLKGGVLVDACDSERHTALYAAALKGHLKCVKELLKRNADPNFCTVRGSTPLHAACFHGNVDVVCTLLESGADVTKVSSGGETPRDCAVRRKNEKVVELLDLRDSFVRGHISHSGISVAAPRVYATSSSYQISPFPSALSTTPSIGSRVLSRPSVVEFGATNDLPAAVLARIPDVSGTELVLKEMPIVLSNFAVIQTATWRGSDVTLKKPAMDENQEAAARRMVRELHIIKDLHHPNVALLMGASIGPWRGNLCLIMEHAANASLDYQLHTKLRRFGVEESCSVMLDVAKGMVYVHSSGYVHSYLNSKSILLTSKFTAKICNFDSARKEGSSCSAVSDFLNMYRWQAEEQLNGMAPDSASDVYSFACVFWECLTGSLPWPSIDVLSIPKVVCIRHKRLEPRQNWPIGIKRLLGQCYARRERRPNFQEVCRKLEASMDGDENPFTAASTPPERSDSPAWDEPWLFSESPGRESTLLENRRYRRRHSARTSLELKQPETRRLSLAAAAPVAGGSAPILKTGSGQQATLHSKSIRFSEGDVGEDERKTIRRSLSKEIFDQLPFLSSGNELAAAASPSSLSDSSSTSSLEDK